MRCVVMRPSSGFSTVAAPFSLAHASAHCSSFLSTVSFASSTQDGRSIFRWRPGFVLSIGVESLSSECLRRPDDCPSSTDSFSTQESHQVSRLSKGRERINASKLSALERPSRADVAVLELTLLLFVCVCSSSPLRLPRCTRAHPPSTAFSISPPVRAPLESRSPRNFGRVACGECLASRSCCPRVRPLRRRWSPAVRSASLFPAVRVCAAIG